MNADVTFVSIRPTLPKVVYIGGIQCHEPRPLEGDLELFVSSSGDAGVIVFSLGGFFSTDALPHDFIETFLDIFKTLQHHVVWKLQSVPHHLKSTIPPNVKIMNWIPQQDLLGHPKTKLFISHGGVQGSFEGICHGTPMLGMALFGDQLSNIKNLVRKGMAILLKDFRNLNKTSLLLSIHKLLFDPKYSDAAKKAQMLFYDQSLTPKERFVFAVNYTIRHNGAPHLTSHAALQLHWFQYYLCDVMLFLFSILLMSIVLVCWLIKKCSKCCVSVLKKEKLKHE